MTIPPVESVTTKEQAKELAIDWQHWQNDQSLSWLESSQWSDFFSQLVEKFPDLNDEFKENGIL